MLLSLLSALLRQRKVVDGMSCMHYAEVRWLIIIQAHITSHHKGVKLSCRTARYLNQVIPTSVCAQGSLGEFLQELPSS